MSNNLAIPGLMDLQTPRAGSGKSVVTMSAGQIADIPAVFTQPSGAPLDLTGATAYLVAKQSYTDTDADAVIYAEQVTHADAAAGKTSLHVDLSGVPDAYYAEGGELVGSVWILDAAGQRLPYGNITITITPSAWRWTTP